MPKWLLEISKNPDTITFEMDEKNVLKEAKKRIKKMRYYIIREDKKRMIAFEMPSAWSFLKFGCKIIYLPLFYLYICIFKKPKNEHAEDDPMFVKKKGD